MANFRKSRRFISSVVIALTLFCQAVLAVAGCVGMERCAAKAYASAPCEHGSGTMNGNLCLAHATAADQSFDGVAITPPIAAPALAGGVAIPAPAPSLVQGSLIDADRRVAAVPPIPILFGNFRS